MFRFSTLIFAVAVASCLNFSSTILSKEEAGKVKAGYLRCQHLNNPLGIEETKPLFSWEMQNASAGEEQSAYRILAADSKANLDRQEGNLWDSGWITGKNCFNILYQGKNLSSRHQVFWKVQLRNNKNEETPWSEIASFTLGLLDPSDWKGRWIGFDTSVESKDAREFLKNAHWIWSDQGKEAKTGKVLFTKTYKKPLNKKIVHAEVAITADDAFHLLINQHHALNGDSWKTVYRTKLSPDLFSDTNEFRILCENTFSAAGLILNLSLQFSDGTKESIKSDSSWLVFDPSPEDWAKKPLPSSEGKKARELAPFGQGIWGTELLGDLPMPPTSVLRKKFSTAEVRLINRPMTNTNALSTSPQGGGVQSTDSLIRKDNKKISQAYVYVTALGLVDLYLNGKRISEDWFNPGWTDYRQRVYYRTYDVTSLLHENEENVLSAVLADGWYAGYVGYGGQRNTYGKNRRLLCQLEIEYSDGSRQTIASDESWKGHAGAEKYADFFKGEYCDSNALDPQWNLVSFDDRSWGKVAVGTELSPALHAHPAQAVVCYEEFRAKKITNPREGIYIYDFGQNAAGVARLTIDGEKGQIIRLRFAERLNPDGTLYTKNLRSADSIDTFVCAGGKQTWEPRFTFHGFQYAEISGLKTPPGPETLVSRALSNDTPKTNEFDSSDPMLNRLVLNTYYTQRANFIDIPTDCPQRDERLGWTGDAQVYINSATRHCDVQAFFHKWLTDLREAQSKNGQFPKIAPVITSAIDGGPAWSDAGVICPWTIFEVYQDPRILEENYEAMKRFVDFCRNRSNAEMLPPKSYHCYGDWLNIKDPTPNEVIYMAYFAHSTGLLAKAAAILEKKEDAEKYSSLQKKIAESFEKHLVTDEGEVRGNSQTGYVLALAYDLITDAKKREKVADRLVKKIAANNNHLSTGFVGTKDLMLVLAKIGRNDLAGVLLHNTTFPSWGFTIQQGETSIWERWDGWTPERGFQDAGMNSFAHYSFGAVYQWMAENLGGIKGTPELYTIQPWFDPQLSFLKYGFRSPYGWIRTEWKRDGNKIVLKVALPPNGLYRFKLPEHRSLKYQGGSIPTPLQDGYLPLTSGEHQWELELP